MPDGRIPKDLLYEELATGRRARGRPHLRYKDVCKRDLKAVDIGVERWEELAADRDRWRRETRKGLARMEARREQTARDKHTRQKNSQRTAPQDTPYRCDVCNRLSLPYRPAQSQQEISETKLIFSLRCRSVIFRELRIPTMVALQ